MNAHTTKSLLAAALLTGFAAVSFAQTATPATPAPPATPAASAPAKSDKMAKSDTTTHKTAHKTRKHKASHKKEPASQEQKQGS